MNKTKVKMKNTVYLDLSILSITKTVMHEFWYDYIKTKYQDDGNLCYMDTHGFIVYIKTKDIYKDIANNVEKRFDTSNYVVEIPLPIGKNRKMIKLIKDELDEKILAEFVGLTPKTYPYLIDDGSGNKKAEGTKKCVIK